MSNKITVDGLTPVSVVDNGNKFDVNVWNRTYHIANSPFFSSILSGGKEVLASPIRLAGTCFGRKIEWEDFENLEMADATDKSVSFVQTTKFRELFLNTSITLEYDGFTKCGITLVPQGWHAGKVYGDTNNQEESLVLNKLWLEIPLKKEFAKFYHINPSGGTIIDGIPTTGNANLMAMDYIPEKSLALPFKNTFYLGNDYTGLSLMFESEQGWNIENKNKVIECINQEDCILVRVHFLDEEHYHWHNKGGFNGGYLFPIHFEFGLQATPVKPFPENQFATKAFHLGEPTIITPNGKLLALEEPLKDYDSDEMLIDVLKKSGVNIIHVHETWNDIQNSLLLTKESSERLKKIVKLAHERGMKVAPYFSWDISFLSPLIDMNYERYKRDWDENHYDFMHGYHTRLPYQRTYPTCCNSEYGELYLEGIARLMDEYHFDGIYLDGTYFIAPCMNEKHGCGYRDEKGNLRLKAPIFAKRKMLEKLHDIVHSRGGIINIHTANTFPVPFLAFADSVWDGETIQPYLVRAKLDSVPDGHFRAMYTGVPLGIPVNTIIYTNLPVWTFHHSISTILPFGVLPKASTLDASGGLDEIAQIWRVYDKYEVSKCEFKPYYENGVKVSNNNVKVSYYEGKDGILAIIANSAKYPTGDTEVVLEGKFKNAVDTMTDKKLELIDGNKLSVNFEYYDYLLVRLEK